MANIMKIEKQLMLNKKETKFNGYCPNRLTSQNWNEVKVVLGTYIGIVNGSLDIFKILSCQLGLVLFYWVFPKQMLLQTEQNDY